MHLQLKVKGYLRLFIMSAKVSRLTTMVYLGSELTLGLVDCMEVIFDAESVMTPTALLRTWYLLQCLHTRATTTSACTWLRLLQPYV